MYDELIADLRNCAEVNSLSRYKRDLMKQAADAIEDLISALTASNEVIAKSKPRWIPVTERLPELNKEVLVYAVGKIDGFIGSSVFALSERFLFKFFPSSKGTEEWRSPWQYFMTDYEITHWMPLPEPPKEE